MTSTNARSPRRLSGPVKLVCAWMGMIALGTVLLRLPGAGQNTPLRWLDALFTSTSAVCVTGLTTIDIGRRLTPFGQATVLALIQIGGLGISTVSTFLLIAFGRASMTSQVDAKQTLAAVRVRPLRLIWWVVSITVVAEAIGTVVLAHCFPGPTRWWLGTFHSVSAFCNAGFSLFTDSLVRYRSDVTVNGMVAALVAVGGLGFIALRQIFLWVNGVLRSRRSPLFLHTRVVLVGSLGLWTLGAVMFLVFEWQASMASLPTAGKLTSAGFQSVTTRTAGFNTLDFATMREPTLFLTMFLMFVGGAPGSCAGGVKVTTAVVVLATIRAHCRGVEAVSMLKRKIPPDIVQRAFQLVTLSVLFLAAAIVGLLVTEERMPPPGRYVDHFTSLAFEATSAFGTVGLSTGITASLSQAGKLLIIVTMFVGRLGPLLVALAVFRPRGRALFEYPEEELAVG